ncbi:MAG: hypothetical protein HFG80_06030 [Eubacterium sp.]|nr:hypothetical protein [Eubacterium sp.]
MLKKILKELIEIRKELQDIKLILKFHCLRGNYRTEHERVDGKLVVKSRRILPDPLEELRKEEHILQQYRKNKFD